MATSCAKIFIAAAACFLSGCAMDVASSIPFERVELLRGVVHESYSMAEFGENETRAIIAHYRDAGDGQVEVIVTYDPSSRNNNAAQAERHAQRIAQSLRRQGIPAVTADTLPQQGSGEISRIAVTYETIEASPPAACDTMGGLDGKPTGDLGDYKTGCTIETLLARQIARPADLAGRADMDAASGRRQANILERYKTAVPNEALEGQAVTTE